MAQKLVLVALRNRQEIQLHEDELINLGRKTILDASDEQKLFVSSKHAKIMKSNHGIIVEDTGSMNGTYVNGVRIDKAKVNPGDIITLGGVRSLSVGETCVDFPTWSWQVKIVELDPENEQLYKDNNSPAPATMTSIIDGLEEHSKTPTIGFQPEGVSSAMILASPPNKVASIAHVALKSPQEEEAPASTSEIPLTSKSSKELAPSVALVPLGTRELNKKTPPKTGNSVQSDVIIIHDSDEDEVVEVVITKRKLSGNEVEGIDHKVLKFSPEIPNKSTEAETQLDETLMENDEDKEDGSD